MRLKFSQTHKVQQHDRNGPVYEAGKVYSFDGPVARTYALKYIARGYAAEVDASTAAEAAVRADGPTVEEWVTAGYQAANYPPAGYASKSTQEDIDRAIAGQDAAKAPPAQQPEPERVAEQPQPAAAPAEQPAAEEAPRRGGRRQR